MHSQYCIHFIQRTARTAISRAERYLLSQYEGEGEFCNYGHALATYGLLRNNENPPRTLDNMLDDLRSRIVTSRACKSGKFILQQNTILTSCMKLHFKT